MALLMKLTLICVALECLMLIQGEAISFGRFRNDRRSQISRLLRVNLPEFRSTPRLQREIKRTLSALDRITRGKSRRSLVRYISTTKESFSRLPSDTEKILSKVSGCQITKDYRRCTLKDHFNRYRSIDGTCNNLFHPRRGAASTVFSRLLSPVYDDHLSMPFGSGRRYLPSPRQVSSSVLSAPKITDDNRVTDLLKTWGQFLDHDVTLTPHVSNTACFNKCKKVGKCFSIRVPNKDKRVRQACLPLGRSLEACGTGRTSIFYGALTPRRQVNTLTAFIDASNVYGSSKEEADKLRANRGCLGCLLQGISRDGKKPLLPFSNGQSIDSTGKVPNFQAGDARVNENTQLTAMHTIWFREHNRIAKELRRINPTWTAEKIYQESRKIVGAQMQKITFTDYLPLIIGRREMKRLGRYRGYNVIANPSIFNSFATSTFRFGHTQIKPIIARLGKDFRPIRQGNLKLFESFFAPERLVNEGGIDPILRGLFATPGKAQREKQRISDSVTESLFNKTHIGFDLAALNIQRGRDHGLPGYTMFRRICRLGKARSFRQFREIKSRVQLKRLRNLYRNPSYVDLFTGSSLETVPRGQQVGPLTACLLRIQFRRLRNGDRYWYQNFGVFTRAQRKEINKASLSRVICDNSDDIVAVPRNAFLLEKPSNFVSCSRIPSINLKYWKGSRGSISRKKHSTIGRWSSL